MERPKQITYMAAWLCIIGAIMIAAGSNTGSIRLWQVRDGTLAQFAMNPQENTLSFGLGVYFSSILVLVVGAWGAYCASRIVVAAPNAISITRKWCRTQSILFVVQIISILSSMMLFAANNGLWAAGHGDQTSRLLTVMASPRDALGFGLGSYLVARYISKSLGREDVQAWFEAAQNAGLDDAEIQGEP